MQRLVVVIAWLVSMPALAQPLSVEIEAPSAGIVHGPIVQLSARVSDPRVTRATLVVNGASYHVPVEQGRVEQGIVAVPGNNRVAVLAGHGTELARDTLTFHYDGPPMELVVLLTWPSEGEVIDLWVREPSGETCKWDHRQTESGGSLLDFSASAIGFGSQGYTLPEVRAGRYRLKVHYWGAWGEDDARSAYTYEQLLSELDQVELRLRAAIGAARAPIEEEARVLRERLDVWARPAAVQTLVHAEAILFPGTPHERRWRFDRVVQRTGQLLTLGEIEITAPMIRDARGGAR
ncbi:MAG: hypothetical protein KF729_25590 [Sandaracinaceae bacterium]|nr:hypothetical protein [Sandaracinaceae bacterium]